MAEKKIFNFFPFDEANFRKSLIVVCALWIIGHIASYIYYGEVSRTDLIGSTIAGFLFAYFIHLLFIYNDRDER